MVMNVKIFVPKTWRLYGHTFMHCNETQTNKIEIFILSHSMSLSWLGNWLVTE
jgi:hypothetical protein